MTILGDALKARRRTWATVAILLPCSSTVFLTAISRHIFIIGNPNLHFSFFILAELAGAILFYCALRPLKWRNRLLSLIGYGLVQVIIYVVVANAIMEVQYEVGVATGRCSKAIPPTAEQLRTGNYNAINQCF